MLRRIQSTCTDQSALLHINIHQSPHKQLSFVLTARSVPCRESRKFRNHARFRFAYTLSSCIKSYEISLKFSFVSFPIKLRNWQNLTAKFVARSLFHHKNVFAQPKSSSVHDMTNDEPSKKFFPKEFFRKTVLDYSSG